MMDPHGVFLLLTALGAVIALIVLIARFQLNPFIVLTVVSLALGILAGMPLLTVVRSFETGVGNILGHIAIVVALGTMLGKMMAESGGAERIAGTLLSLFGEKRVPWAMLLIGLVVGLPVFFEVGFVLLVPIAYTVAKRSGKSLLLVGLPMVMGLSVVHSLVPPHPAALLAVGAYHADIGFTILYALIIGIPSAVVAGPLYARWVAPRIHLDEHNPVADQFLEKAETTKELPGFAVTIVTILLPVALMLLGSSADLFFAAKSPPNNILRLLGSADVALLAGVLMSFVTLGTMRNFSRADILRFSNESLAPTASVTLLVGAGGGFGHILQDSGVSQAIIHVALSAHVSILVLAWLVAAMVRLATGSSTVAMSTAAGIIAPFAAHATVSPELLAISTGAGALLFSHVNDGGFWLVKEYFHMSVADTMKTWSVCETILSILALLLTLAVAAVR